MKNFVMVENYDGKMTNGACLEQVQNELYRKAIETYIEVQYHMNEDDINIRELIVEERCSKRRFYFRIQTEYMQYSVFCFIKYVDSDYLYNNGVIDIRFRTREKIMLK